MSRVAIVTDSVSDMPPDVAARQGITVVPLFVSFGAETFRPNVDLTTDEFWVRMLAPDAPFPTTAAAAPGDFKAAFEAAFDGGADGVVCVNASDGLSGTHKSARIAAGMLEGREIHVIDSRTASMGDRHARPDRRGAGRGGRVGGARSPACWRSARGMWTSTWPSTRSSTSSAAAGSAVPEPPSGACCRSSRSSRSSTVSSTTPTGSGRGRRRASASSSC